MGGSKGGKERQVRESQKEEKVKGEQEINEKRRENISYYWLRDRKASEIKQAGGEVDERKDKIDEKEERKGK